MGRLGRVKISGLSRRLLSRLPLACELLRFGDLRGVEDERLDPHDVASVHDSWGGDQCGPEASE